MSTETPYTIIYLIKIRKSIHEVAAADNVILSSDKRVIMKIVTSAQVMYYFTSAKHE